MLFFGLLSCVTSIPEEELVLAQTAVEAAQEAKADFHSPALFQRAEDYLKAAQKAKSERDFDQARTLALRAKEFAEKAEEEAVIKQEKGENQ
ncbi:MAG: DUF4398 domain-containing protein [Deltaproteobacteria bacterium]|nr:DUF4398 domain-containing protein [Deltaproteobacteria bacterium]